jgi:CHAT domain-containing protein/tetratricopeptide (TPR) repeat protein
MSVRSASIQNLASALFAGALMLAAGLPLACRAAERTVATEAPTARRLPLVAGTMVEFDLAGGRTHAYAFDLAEGQYAELTVDQRGIDVAVSVAGPDGRRLAAIDSPNGAQGPEPLPVIAQAAGKHRLEIRSLDARAAAGRYAVQVQALRPATARDRTRVAAERALAEAEDLRARDDQTSLRRALAQGRRAAGLFHAIGERAREGEAHLSLGLAHRALGEHAAALSRFQQALARFRELDLTPQIAASLNLVGQAHHALNRPRAALDCYREALALSRQTGGRREVFLLNDLGTVYEALGDAEAALASYEQALAGWRKLGNRDYEAYTVYNLARLYESLGKPQKALDDLTQTLPPFLAEGRHREAATILARIGISQALCGRHREALTALRRALALHRRIGNRQGEALALNNLGWVFHRQGRPAEARRLYSRSLAIYRALEDRRNEAWVLGNLARTDEELGRPGAAIASYRRALPLLAAGGSRNAEAGALLGLARARRRTGDLAAARTAAEDAIARIESLRQRVASVDLRASFLASKQDYYGFYVDLLMQLHRQEPKAGYDARALAASEEARARSLLDLLAEAGTDLRRGVDPALLEREAQLGRQINDADRRRLQLARSRRTSAARLAAADRELRDLLARYDRLRAEIRRASPAYAALLETHSLNLEQIQEQVVDAETVLLEYFLGEERSFLWAVTPESLESFELPPRAAIEAAARRAYSLLASSHQRLARSQAELVLAELSRTLLGPLGDRLHRQRLLVAAAGALHYIPFGALPDPASGDLPLAAGHEVVTLPSASSLAALRRELAGRRPAPGLLAVVADPRGGAPAAGLGRLPFSRHEAEAIVAQAPAAQTFTALGFEASRKLVLDGTLGRYRIVHFATHGVFDMDHPELSAIVLSTVGRDGRPQDGLLRAYEIYRLHLPAELVVLSACDTALGEEIRGEGLVGLTRGFLHAGARLLLVSLWQVEDRATAELMRRFYRELLVHRQPPAAALRQAQLAMRREPAWSAPYYWAGFVLQGDWRPVDEKVILLPPARIYSSPDGRHQGGPHDERRAERSESPAYATAGTAGR